MLKINSLLSERPSDPNDVEKWMRIQNNYKLISYQGTHVIKNREIKDALIAMMLDNNDQCWVKYLRWVKLKYKTSNHTTIKLHPMKPFSGGNTLFVYTIFLSQANFGTINKLMENF